MKVAVYQRPTPNKAKPILEAFGEGIAHSGGSVDWIDPLEPLTKAGILSFDCHVVYSATYQNSDKIIALCKRLDRPVIVIDSGYIRRGEYYAVGLGGINGQADFKNDNSPADRFEALHLDLSNDSREGRWYILLAGQHPLDLAPRSPLDWAQAAFARVREHTDLPVVYRPHPSDDRNPGIEGVLRSRRTVEEDLAGALALVTHTSNLVVDGLLAGIPVFTTGKSVAAPVTLQDFEELAFVDCWENASQKPFIQQFLHGLAYAQWTLDEMRDGLPFRRLMGLEPWQKIEPSKKPTMGATNSVCAMEAGARYLSGDGSEDTPPSAEENESGWIVS